MSYGRGGPRPAGEKSLDIRGRIERRGGLRAELRALSAQPLMRRSVVERRRRRGRAI